MKSSSIFAAIAAAAASVTIPMPVSAATQTVTNTVDGIQWQLLIDTSAETLCVGGHDGGGAFRGDVYGGEWRLST